MIAMSLDSKMDEMQAYALQQPLENPWYQQTSTYVYAGLALAGIAIAALVVRKYCQKREQKSDDALRAKLTRRWLRGKDTTK